MSVLEEQRMLMEDNERLEVAMVERYKALRDPKSARSKELNPTVLPRQRKNILKIQHEIAWCKERQLENSMRLLDIDIDENGLLEREKERLTTGDPLKAFYDELAEINKHFDKYPDQPVENLENTYKYDTDPKQNLIAREVNFEQKFNSEEGFGSFFDLVRFHEEYMNLPGVTVALRVPYQDYLRLFDKFTQPAFPLTKKDKMNRAYYKYLMELSAYLENFLRLTKPLEENNTTLEIFDKEFGEKWEKREVPAWELNPTNYCADCDKTYANENVYRHHFDGKIHKKNVSQGSQKSRMEKERAIAALEFRIGKLAGTMQTERSETMMYAERKMGMTPKERQAELDLLSEEHVPANTDGHEGEVDDGEAKIYNPLKLPNAWDGKPIPYWLYKLHGLGNEFPCEICGNYVYMGRRAYEKHFHETRHVHGLHALGITNTTLFKEIASMDDAKELWAKIQEDEKAEKKANDNIVQMEDSQGNVMPLKVYEDLKRQGLL
ncbi:hypothetical protein NA57DRAFT_60490 [Rhizodiscina lignyota]|uniref:C2H2-type domain-containing protein n=1 Tax=Rhizodiscina lignyota TaxID=1504668 RepID=A0A9P4I795_9PEZI|nr:hypothetical protein NA57DRAFT_60490 [Rhizodiscina lignyota]